MKRTFFAVKVSEETKILLKSIESIFPEIMQKIKIANPENPHITLKFLGDTKESDIIKIDENIADKVRNFPQFTFDIESCGCFPSSSNTKVLWLGINKGLKKLQSLHNLVESTLYPFGYKKDKRAFVPHLTLGRVKRDCNRIESINDFLKYKFESISNNVDEITWFESVLTPRGAVHKPLKKYKLI